VRHRVQLLPPSFLYLARFEKIAQVGEKVGHSSVSTISEFSGTMKEFVNRLRWAVYIAGAIRLMSLLLRFWKFVQHEMRFHQTRVLDTKAFRRENGVFHRPERLLKRYSGLNEAWAVVTGGAKGIGESMSREVAKHGFNICIVARDRQAMENMSAAIAKSYGVKTAFVEADMAHVGTSNESLAKLVDEVSRATHHGDIAMLVLCAGNSDLARHFTDHSLDHNRDMLYLNTLSTLMVTQAFMPKLVHRDCRSCIITFGALTSFHRGSPGFATSSGNKAYVRSFTRAISKEFEEDIDIICVHPLSVFSNIVGRSQASVATRQITISADEFATGVLARLGHHDIRLRETFGSTFHEVIANAWTYFEYDEIHLSANLNRIKRYSNILQRPVNLAPIREKIHKQVD